MVHPALLEVENLSARVNGKELLHKINLTIPAGEVHALLGQNGSGKTTLMMIIMGFSGYEITEGHIRLQGKDITELDLTERARLGIGIAEQRPPTIRGVKLRDMLDYILKDIPEKERDELVQVTRTDTFLGRNINEGLSGGEIRRSELLQLLAMKPVFAMLDEPDSGLDMESLSTLGTMINRLLSRDRMCRAKRKAGLIITHNGAILDHVNVDKAHVMMNGRIVCSGNPRIMLDTIRTSGYEECTRCMRNQESEQRENRNDGREDRTL